MILPSLVLDKTIHIPKAMPTPRNRMNTFEFGRLRPAHGVGVASDGNCAVAVDVANRCSLTRPVGPHVFAAIGVAV